MKRVCLVFLAICLAMTAFSFAAQPAQDPLSGTWTGDWGPSPSDRNQVTVELKWDGKTVTGTINPGPNAVTLKNSTFDPKTGEVHFEADVVGRRGDNLHYVVNGKIEGSTMTGSWDHTSRKGDFKITKK
jgi:hypothetical protein